MSLMVGKRELAQYAYIFANELDHFTRLINSFFFERHLKKTVL